MPLITASEVVNLAFASNIDPLLIKQHNINHAEEKYIKTLLGAEFYIEVVENPGSYSILISDYIKPCLAYFVKYVSFNQLLLETANFNDLRDIDTLAELIPSFRSYRISKHLRESVLQEVFETSKFLATKMFQYADENFGPLKPTPIEESETVKSLTSAGFFILKREGG